MLELDAIPGALETTGFPLEHYVARKFAAAKWNILSNRYYIDDIDGKPRELDLIAYKVVSVGDFDLTFAVMISCKKDAENRWVFLSRDKPVSDPNQDWNPIHWWTNVGPLDALMNNSKWKREFLLAGGRHAERWFGAERDVFASQLVSSGGRVKNDKPIFDSISGLMKALEHEKQSLESRVSEKRLYVFLPITVADASLVEANYDSDPVQVSEADVVAVHTNYIVAQKQTTSVIHFISKLELSSTLAELNQLVQDSRSYFEGLNTSAYEAVKINPSVQKYFAKKFQDDLMWFLALSAKTISAPKIFDNVSFSYSEGTLNILLDGWLDDIEKLHLDTALNERVKKWLAQEVRFTGPFQFEAAIPF